MIKVWDIRMVAELGTIDIGQHPINKVSLDRGAKKVLAASDDGTIKVILMKFSPILIDSQTSYNSFINFILFHFYSLKVVDVVNFCKTSELVGHDTAVQCVSISPNDNFVVSGSSDATFKIWSK